jgi:two-component system, chemotaxis family, response regulator Rcp1
MKPAEVLKPVEVLMVEDNPGDVVLVQEAMTQIGLAHHVTVVGDGAEAVDFLHRCGKYTQAPRPDLILLDLKLPRKNGREVLAEIRPDPGLREIPLVLLSSSRSELEIAKSHGLPAQCYLEKPSTYRGFVELVHTIEAFRLATGNNRANGKLETGMPEGPATDNVAAPAKSTGPYPS